MNGTFTGKQKEKHRRLRGRETLTFRYLTVQQTGVRAYIFLLMHKRNVKIKKIKNKREDDKCLFKAQVYMNALDVNVNSGQHLVKAEILLAFINEAT